MNSDFDINSLAGMQGLANRRVLVMGLGASGRAACELLLRLGAQVTAIDQSNSESLIRDMESLRVKGINVRLGAKAAPNESFDMAVASPGVPCGGPLLMEIRKQGVPIIGELELGYQHSLCPNIAITGTNGKTTTTELVEQMLTQCHLKTVAAGNIGLPLCAVVSQTANLDWLTLEVSSFQLETVRYFHPAVAVLLNLTPDHLDRYADMADYIRAKARIFLGQRPCDWAIIQLEAWRQMEVLRLPAASRLITISAHDSQADLYLEHGKIISRTPLGAGVLLDMAQGQLRGPHNAENLMAALAVGLVLRLPAAEMARALQSYAPAPHRCELVAEVDGVQFINDSKATNVDAVRQALLTARRRDNGAANVWLIAGGKDKGFEYEEIGALLAERVRGAFLIGETREKIRNAWHRFTPCTLAHSLLEAVTEAAQCAKDGDVVLLSPACSSFDMFQNYQHRGEVFRQAVSQWAQQREGT